MGKTTEREEAKGRTEAGRFAKGRSGNPGGQPHGNTAARLLRDIRAVYEREEGKDRTPGQRRCREWLKEDRKGFLSKLADLEKAQATAEGKGKVVKEEAGPVAPDEAEERVGELIERMLKELGGKP